MPPSNETLDERTKRMEKDISEIKESTKNITKTINSFINTVKENYITEDEAKKMFANKWVQETLKWIGIAMGSSVLALVGRALIFYIKNENGPL